MAYVLSSLILHRVKKTSQSSVNLGCASCPPQCTQTSGQLNYKTEQYILSNLYLWLTRVQSLYFKLTFLFSSLFEGGGEGGGGRHSMDQKMRSE